MAGPFAFGEAEVLTFTQRGGESLKDAWYRINDSQNRATKKQSTAILLRNFYVGINSWNRFLLDNSISGNFTEAPVWEALNVIENLVGSLPIASIKEDITLAHIMRKLEKIELEMPSTVYVPKVPRAKADKPIAKRVETVKTLEETPIFNSNETPIDFPPFDFIPRSIFIRPLFEKPIKTSCTIEEVFYDNDGSIDTT